MKFWIKFILIGLFGFLSQVGLSQTVNWSAKLQLVVDPDNPNAVLVQAVPDMEGHARLSTSSQFYLVSDADMEPYTFEYLYSNWTYADLFPGYPDDEAGGLICGRFFSFRLNVTNAPIVDAVPGEPV